MRRVGDVKTTAPSVTGFNFQRIPGWFFLFASSVCLVGRSQVSTFREQEAVGAAFKRRPYNRYFFSAPAGRPVYSRGNGRGVKLREERHEGSVEPVVCRCRLRCL